MPEFGLVALLRSVGVSFVGLGMFARIPPAMLSLGLTLYGYAQLNSFAATGSIVAGVALGTAVGGPLVGAAADRWGQRRAGIVAATVTTVALLVLVLMLRPGTGLGWLVALALLTGAGNPQVGAMARSRWVAQSRRHDDRARYSGVAMAYEGAIDEAAFVVGPVSVSLLTLLHPLAGLGTALVLGLLLPMAFAVHPTALPPGRTHQLSDSEPVRVPWLRLVPAGMVCAAIGVIFGSSSTGITAWLTGLGLGGWTGIVYGAMGVGSALSGLATTRIPVGFGQGRRLVVFGTGLLVVSPGLALAGSPGLLALACFLCGCCLAPALIAAFAIGEQRSPLAQISTVMTVLGTCVTVGVATGSSLGGVLVDIRGARSALLLPILAAAVAALSGLINRKLARSRG